MDKPPIILKTPRVYYNTPWAEKTATLFNFDNLSTLHNAENFKRIGQLSKTQEFKTSYQLIVETKENLETTLQQLELAEINYQNKLKNGKSKQLSRKLELLQIYLSQAYGRYDKGKNIQEVSWNWLDLAILTGLDDLIGFYSRPLKLETPLAPTFFLSAGQCF